MKTITLNLPDNLDIENQDISMILASNLYQTGKLSLGQAAEMVGLSKRAFAELLGKFNISIFNFPPSEITRDVANA